MSTRKHVGRHTTWVQLLELIHGGRYSAALCICARGNTPTKLLQLSSWPSTPSVHFSVHNFDMKSNAIALQIVSYECSIKFLLTQYAIQSSEKATNRISTNQICMAMTYINRNHTDLFKQTGLKIPDAYSVLSWDFRHKPHYPDNWSKLALKTENSTSER